MNSAIESSSPKSALSATIVVRDVRLEGLALLKRR